jgi:uncharacterized repeat protein (TIGR03847 family)
MTSFDLSSPDAFTPGTVGPPGQRVFYLQAREENLVVTVRCEKQQVAALAEYFGGLLDDLDPSVPVPSPGALDLVEPVIPIWTVGPIGVAYDDGDDRIVVVLEELVVDEEDPEGVEALEDDEDDDEGPTGETVRVRLTRTQVSGFVHRARELVAAGRPPCRFCGLPVDPAGHPCPRMN